MNPAIEKLVKYLRLESDRGYDNKAVVGGLERMLEPWRAEARQTGIPDTLIEAVVTRLRDYPQLSPSSREEALRGLWTRLRSEFPGIVTRGEQVQPAETQRAEESRTPAVPEPSLASSAEALPSAEPPAAALEADKGAASLVPEPELPEEGEEGPEVEEAEEEEEAPPKVRAPAASRPPAPPPALSAPLTTVQGIGPKSARTLERLGLRTLEDLLWHLPRRYDDYSQLKTISRLWYGEDVTIIGTVEDLDVRPTRGGKMKLVEAVVSDGTGALRVTWFNQPWIAERIRPGRPVVLSGRVEQYLGRLTMNNPEWEPVERQQLHTNRIVPVYPLTAGVSAKWLRRVISSVAGRLAPRLPDPIPQPVLASAELMPLSVALQQVHFPDSWERLHQAQHRLAFDEMFLLQLGVLRQKREWTSLTAHPLTVDDSWIARFETALPYELTSAQHKALHDVRSDLAAPRPMNRLLQGDVGSGKTIIAAAATGIAVANGAQAALMAPTSILADQHYQTLLGLLPQAAGVPAEAIRLLVGATPESEKQEIRTALQEGSIRIVVGTHALLEDPVTFARLAVAIIDEQHRFGVEQRAALRQKGHNPHLMVMTATPIPRSLALTVYGDLDLTLMDEMPPGRQPVETRVLRPVERTRAYSFIRSQLEAGHQAFIIYPLVEESEKIDARAAVEEHRRLLEEEAFAGYRLGLLHGRLRPDEKDATMARFRAGEDRVLVSTSVVELGVDVPNATVTLIEGANRFGLAQLHQFRGRVGRSEFQSYCLLIPDTEDEAENERLKALETTNDGFKLAELDLQQRGPGEFLGSRQSGFAELRMARLTDVHLIEKARREAGRLFEQDPDLSAEEHRLLAAQVEQFWSTRKGEIS